MTLAGALPGGPSWGPCLPVAVTVAVTVTMAGALPGGSFPGPCLPVAVTVAVALAGVLPGGPSRGPCLPVIVTVAVALAGALPVSLHVTKKKIIPTKTGCLLPSFDFSRHRGFTTILRKDADRPAH